MIANVPRESRRRLALAAVLSLAFALCVLVACSSSKSKLSPEQRAVDDVAEYEAEIRKVVKDSMRADKLVAMTREFEGLVDAASRDLADYRARLDKLNSDYTATRGDYAELFRAEDSKLEALMEKAIALRGRMAQVTTDEEWEELRKLRVDAWQAELEEMQA